MKRDRESNREREGWGERKKERAIEREKEGWRERKKREKEYCLSACDT